MKIMPMRTDLHFWRSRTRPIWVLGLSTLLLAPLPAQAKRTNDAATAARTTRTIPAISDAGHGGVVVDAIAAVVNREAITQSEVEDAAWFARFSAHTDGAINPSPLSAHEYQQALQHLIDQDLLLQEQKKAGYDAVPEKAVQSQVDALAQRMGGMEKLQASLQQFHLQMTAVRTMIRQQLNVLRFLDEKLRPSIVIDEQQIETYYQKDFVPAARARKLQPASLEKVRDEIRRILLEQEMGREQQQWLQQLRASAVIETRHTALSPIG
jgi:hypothetical protein